MTTHELATETWAKIKADLSDRSMYEEGRLAADTVAELDAAQVAIIADAIDKAHPPAPMKRIGLVDTARLDFHKPEAGRFEVTGQAISDTGKVVVLPGQEIVIRHHEGKCLIAVRG